MYWAFYVVAATMLFVCAWLVSQRVRNYERGKPDDRRTTRSNVHRRMKDFRAGVWMQTLLRDPAAGVMHSFIYFGFLWLFIATVVLEIDHQLPDNLKFLHGGVYQGYSFAAEIGGVVFVTGIAWAIGRRYVQRPYRIRIKTKPEDAVILGTFLVIGVTGFLTEALRIAAQGRPDFEKWSFVGYGIASWFGGWTLGNLEVMHRVLWGVHFAAFVAFLVILPTTKLRHMITSPMNMYLRDKDRPKGAMRAMPNLMETELDTFGASTVEDFTWKQLFDTDACTVCGRCTSVCPAHATGKPLDPREIVLKVGEVMASTGDPAVSPPVGLDKHITISADNVFERVTLRGALGVHHVQGVRRDLPGEHRDPRQDPRHAPLPVAHGERLPRRARQHVPLDGELPERLRHEPGRPRRLGGEHRGRRHRRARLRAPRARVPVLDRLRGLASTTATRRRRGPSPSCCSAPGSTSRSSGRASSAPATRRVARATSTCSRCSRWRTSRTSTASA